MNREFSVNTASKGSIFFGAIIGLIGIGVMIFFSILYGALLFVGAVILFFLMSNFANDISISCYDHGFSVKVINKRKGTSVQDYKWEDVISTQYMKKILEAMMMVLAQQLVIFSSKQGKVSYLIYRR